MAKALKPLIIALFILSAVSLGLGIMLFGKREILKGRVNKLQDGHERVASSIHYDGFNKSALLDYATMDRPLSALNQAAKIQYDELVDTTQRLEEKTAQLEETEKTLETTQAELADRIERVGELETEVNEKNEEIARKERSIRDLETAKADQEEQIASLEADLTKTQEDLLDAEANYKSLNEAYVALVKEIEAATSTGEGEGELIDFEVRGRVLVANPEWNFVVLDKGKGDNLTPNVLLLVHRNTVPVGKIRIRMVEEDLSVAEIIQEWEGRDFAAGDEYISPKAAPST